jgi:hypothetical protein
MLNNRGCCCGRSEGGIEEEAEVKAKVKFQEIYVVPLSAT